MRSIVILWSFLSLFLINYFQSDLQALEASQNPIRIENFKKLYENSDIKVLVIEGSNMKTLISKRHKELNQRLIYIKQAEKFSEKTMMKIVNDNMVLIESHELIKLVIEHYHQYNLIQTHDHKDFNLLGFPLRKSLRIEVQNKFSNL